MSVEKNRKEREQTWRSFRSPMEELVQQNKALVEQNKALVEQNTALVERNKVLSEQKKDPIQDYILNARNTLLMSMVKELKLKLKDALGYDPEQRELELQEEKWRQGWSPDMTSWNALKNKAGPL